MKQVNIFSSSDDLQLINVIAETVGDYVVMYQHARQQQKLRLQEKEEQLAQVARDKDELRAKLSSLQEMVTRLIARDQGGPAPVTEAGYVETK